MKSLTEKYDQNNVHLTVYAGAGGDDAKDWAEMLVKMYLKLAQRKNWQAAMIAGRTIEIKGPEVYERLKNEVGVHRLVRISPFSAKRLRHTSFALVEVVPEFPEIEAKKLQIPAEDLKIEMSRSSGPGGQNVNKRETAVRVVHLPTGLAAASENQRSQLQNREKALRLLKGKILKLMEEKQAQELSALRTKVAPEWGHQIRSYILHPYKLVKDHRTNVESSQPDEVLDGAIDEFIEAELTL